MRRIGEILQQTYQLDEVLGPEELGTAYLASGLHHRRGGRYGVLLLREKLDPYHPGYFAVLSALRKARVLRDRGLVTIEAVMTDDGTPGFASEIVPSHQRLSRYLRSGPLRVERALSIGLSLGKTMAIANQLGVIHGDLRPHNILLTDLESHSVYAGRAVLIWHSLHHLRSCVNVDSESERVMYRPRWQVQGEGRAADTSTDLFGLGAVLYECLSGRPAFAAPVLEQVLENLTGPPPPLPVDAAVGLSASVAALLDRILARALSPDPARSFPSMSEFVAALEAVIQEAGLALDSDAPTQRFTRRVERGGTLDGWADLALASGGPLHNEISGTIMLSSNLLIEDPTPPSPHLPLMMVDLPEAEPVLPAQTPAPSIHERPTELFNNADNRRVQDAEALPVEDRPTELLRPSRPMVTRWYAGSRHRRG